MNPSGETAPPNSGHVFYWLPTFFYFLFFLFFLTNAQTVIRCRIKSVLFGLPNVEKVKT